MKTIATIIYALISFSILAQEPPIKWKEIPIEDLKMTSCDLDPSAPAVVLCDYGQMNFNINSNGRNLFLFYIRHLRIKILNTDGLKYAKFNLTFMDMACEELISENPVIIKGMVYNLSEKGELLASKLKNKDIKYRDTSNCKRIAEIYFPDVKPGSIIDLFYQKPTLDFIQPESWYFQREIPTLYSEFRIRVPRAFQYVISPQNFEDFEIEEKSFYNSSILFNFASYRHALIDISGAQMRFANKNIEAFNCQGFITKPEDYMPKLNIHLSNAIQENSTDAWRYLTRSLMLTTYEDYDEYQPIQRKNLLYPSAYKLFILPDWEKFNSNLLNSTEFGLPLITYWNYQEHLVDIIKGKTNSYEEMLAIYDYIRKNIKWNKEYDNDVSRVHGKFISKMYTKVTKKQIKEKSLAEPFENKEGSSSEINFLLIYLLNKVGIEAHPVIISTRDHGKIDSNIPEINQFNHIIAYVDLGENQLLLDATDSLRPYQYLDKSDLNSVGYLVRGKDFGWINIANNRLPELNIAESISIDENMNITRKTNISDNIYDEIDHRKKIKLVGIEKFITEYLAKYPGVVGKSQIEIKNLEKDSLPLTINFMEKVELINTDVINILPNFHPAYAPQDFPELERKCPVDFNYPFKQNYFLQIDLPEGYVVKLPENEEITLYGNHATYKYSANLTGNKIMVKINLQILINEFPNIEYQNLKELFTKLNEKLKESIDLRKSTGISNQ